MEESILQRISELRKQDMTYQGIADLFNSENMPTSTGKGKWDKRTIQRALEQSDKDITLKQLRKEFDDMILQNQAYQGEISERDSLISQLNRTIEDLTTRLANSVPRSPNHFEGWTLVKGADGKLRAFKKFSGKTVAVYIGKEFTPEIARKKIAEMTARIKIGTSVTLLPKKGRKPKAKPETPPSSCAFPFESRLRVLCSANRTYRIDRVRSAFPEMDKGYFDLEMKALADQKKIELLHGDPSDCNPDELIRIGDRLFVNFEWRA